MGRRKAKRQKRALAVKVFLYSFLFAVFTFLTYHAFLSSCEDAPLSPSPLSESAPPRPARVDEAVQDDRPPYLYIVVPTTARDQPYLERTLAVLEAQLPYDPTHPYGGRIKILVWDTDHGRANTAFRRAKQRLESSIFFEFRSNPRRTVVDFSKTRPRANANKPGAAVQQQTQDVTDMLDAMSGQSNYILIMEDDFSLCPGSLRTIVYLLGKVSSAFPNFLSVKISYGFNGIILHNMGEFEDTSAFSRYVRQGVERRPPDHLCTEWWAGETPESKAYKGKRPHITFRYNLLEHFGDVSSLQDKPMGKYPECFHLMDTTVMFAVDAFDMAKCSHDDISPCVPLEEQPSDPFIGIPFRPPVEDD